MVKRRAIPTFRRVGTDAFILSAISVGGAPSEYKPDDILSLSVFLVAFYLLTFHQHLDTVLGAHDIG